MIGPPASRPGAALVLLGGVGIGKSALLAEAAGQARARGMSVLSAAGREKGTGQGFAGLRQLLRPVLLDLLAAPGKQAEDLRAALGLDASTAEPGRARVAAGLAELLGDYAARVPGVLILVDDAQWLDSASLDVLALAARSLDAGSAPVILASRGWLPPAGFEHAVDLYLGPLTGSEAGELLDAQPTPPTGHLRVQVIDQAEGNPLALTELARAVAADASAGRTWTGLPLPLTDRLRTLFAARLASLPPNTRKALLLVAVADRADRMAMASAARYLRPEVLAPAEELGLISVDARGPRFRHPLGRSAVYHGESFATRAAAHLEMAALLDERPDRQAWHLAAAALAPNEDIASLLATTAAEAGHRGGPAATAAALQRAADLSPDPCAQAGRYVVAAEAALSAGQPEWARDLASRAVELRPGRDLAARAEAVAGWALACTGRYASAAAALLPLAREAGSRAPGTAWHLIGQAAAAAYHCAEPDVIQAVADALGAAPPAADDDQAARLWALAVTGQTHKAAVLLRWLTRRDGHELGLAQVGAAARLLDRTADAIESLRAARDAYTSARRPAGSDGLLGELGWAYLDAGLWDEALKIAAQAQLGLGSDIAPAMGMLLSATIEAARGNTADGRELVAAALAADRDHCRLVTARARHALGLAALADGDFRAAFDHLRPLFSDDGRPYHRYVSYLAIGDLAVAAHRSECPVLGREIIKRARATLAGTTQSGSPRLGQVFARADGILADPSYPGAYPADVASGQAGVQWPFERAQLCLEHGEWLRRQRRINEAKPVLAGALDAFRLLRARPWERRTEAELRACGISVSGTTAHAAGLSALTPQQRRIIGLAAQGLSNREIAQRMYLSPRTVASHLHRSFPKLGVAGRHQLTSLLADPDRQG